MNTLIDKAIVAKLIQLSDAIIAISHKVDEVYTDYTLRGKSIPSYELEKIFRNAKELKSLGVSFDDYYGITSSFVKLETLALSLVSNRESNQVGSGIRLLGVALSNAALTYEDLYEMRSVLRDRYPDISIDGMRDKEKVIALLAAEIETIGYRSGTYDYKYHLVGDDVGFLVEKALGQ